MHIGDHVVEELPSHGASIPASENYASLFYAKEIEEAAEAPTLYGNMVLSSDVNDMPFFSPPFMHGSAAELDDAALAECIREAASHTASLYMDDDYLIH